MGADYHFQAENLSAFAKTGPECVDEIVLIVLVYAAQNQPFWY